MLLQKGDPEEALAEMQQESGEPPRLAGLSMAYHALGRSAKSDAALAEIIKKYEKTSAASIAMVFAFRARLTGWTRPFNTITRISERRLYTRCSRTSTLIRAGCHSCENTVWPPSSSRRSSST
jgi:hypothetical protein